jgi:hypothetical protein
VSQPFISTFPLIFKTYFHAILDFDFLLLLGENPLKENMKRIFDLGESKKRK